MSDIVCMLDEFSDKYTNEITEEIDKHLREEYIKYNEEEDYYKIKTCMWERDYFYNPPESSCPIRCHGATRGHINIDKDDIITNIQFYEDTCFGIIGIYNETVNTIKDKFIGRKVIFPVAEL